MTYRFSTIKVQTSQPGDYVSIKNFSAGRILQKFTKNSDWYDYFWAKKRLQIQVD